MGDFVSVNIKLEQSLQATHISLLLSAGTSPLETMAAPPDHARQSSCASLSKKADMILLIADTLDTIETVSKGRRYAFRASRGFPFSARSASTSFT